MTETVMTPVVCAVDIDAPREKVFSLFTTPDELVRWWPDAVTLDAKESGDMRLEFEGRGYRAGDDHALRPAGRARIHVDP